MESYGRIHGFQFTPALAGLVRCIDYEWQRDYNLRMEMARNGDKPALRQITEADEVVDFFRSKIRSTD